MMQAVLAGGPAWAGSSQRQCGKHWACSPHIRVWSCSLSNKLLSHKILNIPLQCESYCHSVVEGLGEF